MNRSFQNTSYTCPYLFSGTAVMPVGLEINQVSVPIILPHAETIAEGKMTVWREVLCFHACVSQRFNLACAE